MPAIMLQGTGSSVGKSTLVAGLCRAARRRGLRVAPFKPQNMSNNAAVVAGGGGEIGRAQALQARAAGVASTVDMNPVLLKPQGETGAQVVVHGKVVGQAQARAFQAMKPGLLPAVLDSFERLRAAFDLVVVEGAGSASEINLRAGDIANMGFAQATGTPVVLVGDIDRGGVIAALVGTAQVIDPADAALIRGFIVNRMRGDPSLFSDGMQAIADRTGWDPLGLVLHCDAVRRLPAEDAADLQPTVADGPIRIAIPRLPGIANFDDLDPLQADPALSVCVLGPGQAMPADTTLVILLGSKTTIGDLAALRAEGWDIDILAHARRGGHVLGLCGGYQMLGRTIVDPDGTEGPPQTVMGLGLLEVETTLTGQKCLTEATGRLASGEPLSGYEIHLGRTDGPDTARPFAFLADGRPDGAVSRTGRIAGTYLHGLFCGDRARAALLGRVGASATPRDHEADVDAALDALADHVERHVAVERLFSLAR